VHHRFEHPQLALGELVWTWHDRNLEGSLAR
jgi:hypothetical protein